MNRFQPGRLPALLLSEVALRNIRILLLSCLLGLFSQSSYARGVLSGYCEKGAERPIVAGLQSITFFQRSYPSCTITVYLQGTSTLATLYSDNSSTPKSNPFVSSSSGYWFFFADANNYDVKSSGSGVLLPFLRSMTIGGTGSGSTGADLFLSNLTAPIAIPVPLLPAVAGGVAIGSATLPFSDLFLAGTSVTPASNNFKITGASTSGTRVVTLANGASVTVIADAGASNNFLTGITTTGAITRAQPSFSNLSGTATNAQLPLIFNISTATSTAPIKAGLTSATPGTCTANVDFYVKTDAVPAGQQLFLCNSSGTGFNLVGDGGGAAGANTGLSNLASVAINTALLPGAAGTIDLGSTTLPFRFFYFAGTSGTPDTNNFKLQGASTSGTRTITAADGNSVTVIADAGASNNFLTGITTAGAITKAQPAFTNLSGAASNAQIAEVLALADLTDVTSKTGSGTVVVMATTPTLVTPVLGIATATSINKVAITAPATSATITIADGKTLTLSNSLTLAGTDSTTITFQGTDTYVGRATTDTLTNKTLTSPILTTPTLGIATATSINKVTITQPATSATITIANLGTLATSGAFSITLTATAGTTVTLPISGTLATLTGTEAFTNKTLTVPIVGAYTVAGLPAAGTANRVAIVTDAATAGSCTSGSGSLTAWCRDNGSTWEPLGDGGGSGSGSVTSVDASGGVETTSGSPIITTGIVRGSHPVNSQTSTTYTVLTGDRGKLVSHSNASAIAVTLPQAGGTFPANWSYSTQNRGAGTVTITPTTSTIDGAATLVLTTDQGANIYSDGTNYFTERGQGGFITAGTGLSASGRTISADTAVLLTQAVDQAGTPRFVSGGGSASAATGCPTPVIAALVGGMQVYLRLNAANTGALTFNLCSLGAKNVYKQQNAALVSGDLKISAIHLLVFNNLSDSGAGAWELRSSLDSAGGGGGANTSLNNLAAVAINTALLPGAAGTIDLGSATLPFRYLYLAGTSGTPGTNNFQFVGASTSGTRTITLADGNSVTVIPDSGTTNQAFTALSAGGALTKTTFANPALSDLASVSINASLTFDVAANYAINMTRQTSGAGKSLTITSQSAQLTTAGAGGTLALQSGLPVGTTQTDSAPIILSVGTNARSGATTDGQLEQILKLSMASNATRAIAPQSATACLAQFGVTAIVAGDTTGQFLCANIAATSVTKYFQYWELAGAAQMWVDNVGKVGANAFQNLDGQGFAIGTSSRFTRYNNWAVSGMGLVAIPKLISSTGQVASISTANLQCNSGVCPAGVYRVSVYTIVTATGTGTLLSTIAWNDGTAARSIASAGVATTATNYESVSYVIRADGVNNITYATTLSVSGTYSIYVTVEDISGT